MQEEIWKDIPDYDGYYQVSNMGNVKSLFRKVNGNNSKRPVKERILKPYLNKLGYYTFNLNKDGVANVFKAHQLVAMAFLGHIPNGNKLVIDHINSNKVDNRVDNLQIITNRENLSKDKFGYSSKYVGVSINGTKKKWVSKIRIKDKLKHLGVFKNPKIARAVYLYELEQIKNYEAIDKQKVLSIYNLITRY